MKLSPSIISQQNCDGVGILRAVQGNGVLGGAGRREMSDERPVQTDVGPAGVQGHGHGGVSAADQPPSEADGQGGRVQAGVHGADAAEKVRRANDGRAGRADNGAVGFRGERQGHPAGPGAVHQVQAHAGRRVQHDADRHGRGTGRAGPAGRARRPAGRGRGAAQGRGRVQARRRGAGGRDRGPGAARAQARGGRGQDRGQGVHGRGQGRKGEGPDAGRGGRLRGMHQTTAGRRHGQYMQTVNARRTRLKTTRTLTPTACVKF